MRTKPYEYSPLHNPLTGIRLLHLLPGASDSELKAQFYHETLEETLSFDDGRLGLKQLQGTLPADWEVWETHEGSFIFGRPLENQRSEYTWKHPVPDFDESRYQLPDDVPHAKPEYEALSYVWGEEEVEEYILISHGTSEDAIADGGPRFRRLGIRPNLEAALRHLRRLDSPRTLWIDALCINQADNAEKSMQVQRMSQVYRLAHRVLVWLGPGSSESNHALSTLRYLGQQVAVTTDNFTMMSPDATEKRWFHRGHDLPYSPHTWAAIESLFRNSWFTRLWIIQEIVLANRFAVLQCGHDTIGAPTFRSAVQCLRYKESLPSDSFSALVVSIHRAIGTKIGDTFNTVLANTRTANCRDPKDKIYGMLALIPPQLALGILPDYGSTPTADIYRDTFLLYATQSRRLDLLSYVNCSDYKSAVPSWVPDWSNQSALDGCIPDQFAAGCSSARFDFQHPSSLRVSGKMCGTIETISSPCSGEWHEICGLVRSMSNSASGKQVEHDEALTGDQFADYAESVVGGKIQERWPGFGWPALEDWMTDMRLGVNSQHTSAFPRMVRLARSLCRGRVFVETDSGLRGIAPVSCKLGTFSPFVGF